MENAVLDDSKEAEILNEIRVSEKRAEELIEKAGKEKEAMIQDAIKSSSELLNTKKEEIKKLQEKKIVNFRDKVKSIKEEKLMEGKKTVNQIKKKAEKNVGKAIDLVMEKFEAMI